jgi:hypothetical protein
MKILFPALAICVGLVWTLLLIRLRGKSGPVTVMDFFLAWMLGPIHVYMRKRQYMLTPVEIVGWLVVLVLMGAAPWLDLVAQNLFS